MFTEKEFALPEESVKALIDKAILTDNIRTARPRNYLGASAIGESCLRKIQYGYEAVPPDEDKTFTAQQLRIFKRGHLFEAVMAEWIANAGFDLRTLNKAGKPYGFLQAVGKVKGHADGVVLNGPESFAYPMLWECKALGSKSWKEIAKHGLTKAKPIYATQIALYQTYLELYRNPALFTALNCDTMEIYVELVPYNAELSQIASDRALQVILASEVDEVLPRITNDPDYFECKFCSWKNHCWKESQHD